MKKVCVIGLGYIGLPAAILAAQSGFEVVGVDVDKDRVDAINAGKPLIEEPELVERLATVLGQKALRATDAYHKADYFMIAVPTPFTPDKKADVSYVFAAAKSLSGVLKKGDTVILESTVPVGTTHELGRFIASKTGLELGVDFYVAHCPERVIPGNIFHELQVNDRVVGGIDRFSTKHVAAFYKQFVSGDLYLTTAQAAEMIKLVENSYRDVNIAFAHQVASMAYAANIDPYDIIEIANKHPRVNILKPTCGVGGHCLAVDPWFLVQGFPEHSQLLKEARLINNQKPFEVLTKIQEKIDAWKSFTGQKDCTVALLGATYKPHVDDLRESPALTIINELLKKRSCSVVVCEPYVTAATLQKYTTVASVSFSQAVTQADIIVCLVAHKEFKALDKTVIAHKKVLDFCGIFHEDKRQSHEQEQLYWTAAYKDKDFFVASTTPNVQEIGR